MEHTIANYTDEGNRLFYKLIENCWPNIFARDTKADALRGQYAPFDFNMTDYVLNTCAYGEVKIAEKHYENSFVLLPVHEFKNALAASHNFCGVTHYFFAAFDEADDMKARVWYHPFDDFINNSKAWERDIRSTPNCENKTTFRKLPSYHIPEHTCSYVIPRALFDRDLGNKIEIAKTFMNAEKRAMLSNRCELATLYDVLVPENSENNAADIYFYIKRNHAAFPVLISLIDAETKKYMSIENNARCIIPEYKLRLLQKQYESVKNAALFYVMIIDLELNKVIIVTDYISRIDDMFELSSEQKLPFMFMKSSTRHKWEGDLVRRNTFREVMSKNV